MKKNLLIIGIFIILLMTGCKANYSLEIENNGIKETFSVIESDSNLTIIPDDTDKTFYDYSKIYGEEVDIETDYTVLYSDEECTSNCTYYNKKYIENNKGIGFSLDYIFDFENYSNSSIANEVIPGFSSHFDGRYLLIVGGDSWNFADKYNYLEEVNVTINTNYRVVDTNLKKEKNDVYKWTVKNQDEKNSKKLYIRLDTKNVEEKIEDKDDMLWFLIIILSGFVLFIVYNVVNNRKK